jgi:hypothetical protein
MDRVWRLNPRRRRMLSVSAPAVRVDGAWCRQHPESNGPCLCPVVFGATTLWRMDPDRRMGMLAGLGI